MGVDKKQAQEADRKFFALRNGGYKGPIDQDGNKVTKGKEYEILMAMQKIGKSGKH